MFCANVRGRSLAYARNPSERARSALPSGMFSHTSAGNALARQRAEALPEQVALAVRDDAGDERASREHLAVDVGGGAAPPAPR